MGSVLDDVMTLESAPKRSRAVEEDVTPLDFGPSLAAQRLTWEQGTNERVGPSPTSGRSWQWAADVKTRRI